MRSTCVARRLTLTILDLVLVTTLLAGFGSGSWAWLGGPLSALAIWGIDCSKRRSPSHSHNPARFRSAAQTETGQSPAS